jgi:hypothetical protein
VSLSRRKFIKEYKQDAVGGWTWGPRSPRLAIGIPLAAVVSIASSRLLLGVHPLDSIAFLGVSVVLVLVSLAASYVPARRATAWTRWSRCDTSKDRRRIITSVSRDRHGNALRHPAYNMVT